MKLGVNIDHVATLRNARGGKEPCVLTAGKICEELNVSAITIHLREDRRHIKDADALALKKNVSTNINLEMATTDEMQNFALSIMPHSVCLVPERRQELTTEGGLDVLGQIDRMKNFIAPIQEKGIIVSMFIDPDEAQVRACAEIGADFIELHTGSFANAYGGTNSALHGISPLSAEVTSVNIEFERLKNAAKLAQSLGLKVNAGHGLNYENVCEMHKIEGLIELNIGHSIISRAIFVGLERAIVEMKELIER